MGNDDNYADTLNYRENYQETIWSAPKVYEDYRSKSI